MRVLLVGNSAREHIIAEKIAQHADLYAVMNMKNPGIAKLAKAFTVCNIEDPKAVTSWAVQQHVDLAFVSPDPVLAAGVSDALAEAGIPLACPLKEAARIEWDKGFARRLMHHYNIPGAVEFHIVKTEAEARKALRDLGEIAVKPLGLTGGKGVRISGEHLKNDEEVIAYANDVIKKDGAVLLEKKIDGEEFSLQAFCDGETIKGMPPVQDHKRAFANDEGPNTGGMGSYSTGSILPFLTKADVKNAEEIMQHIIYAMRKEGTPFSGVLYGQFMATKDGPKIIEFNSRFGDPEAMNVLSVLQTDLVEVLQSIADGDLCAISFSEKSTVVKYAVPEGYPVKAVPHSQLEIDYAAVERTGARIYNAAVYERDGKIYTTTSRALAVAAVSDDISLAEKKVEEALAYIRGPVWHRKDIGTPALLEKRINHMKKLRGM